MKEYLDEWDKYHKKKLDEWNKYQDDLELKKLEHLTEEPLKSDCTGEIQQEYNRVSIFTRFWQWLKGLFN